jgi:alginate O-acetyltransferase complex protein AlgI
MAIGLGRMFGFRFTENFRWPYIAATVQEFWRRWHISLSTWFRDYLYIPLGGNRVPPARRYRNLVTVFFLCGLWHGASWNFVIWGLWHGTFLVIERVAATWSRTGERMDPSSATAPTRQRADPASLTLPIHPPASSPTVSVFAHVYTMLVVMIGWVFFRAETLSGAVAFLAAMAGQSPALPTPFTVRFYLTPELWIALVAGVIGSMPWVSALAERARQRESTEVRASGFSAPAFPAPGVRALGFSALDVAATAALVAIFIASVLQVAARTYNPFIYFRF